jgi:hypothetical protein
MKIQEIIPNITYAGGEYRFLNIFHKYNLATPIEDRYLQVYSMSDGESLEDVSFEMYGDTQYFWTIIIVNDFNDPIFDLALPEDTIQEIARDLATDVDGNLDLSEYSTQYDLLTDQNDAKKSIKVIKNEYLSSFLTQIIRESVNT